MLVVALHRNNRTIARKDFLGAYDTEKEAIKVRDEIKVRYGGGKLVEPTPPESWTKEFDTTFGVWETTVYWKNFAGAIKFFISNLLKEERDSIHAAMLGMPRMGVERTDWINNYFNNK